MPKCRGWFLRNAMPALFPRIPPPRRRAFWTTVTWVCSVATIDLLFFGSVRSLFILEFLLHMFGLRWCLYHLPSPGLDLPFFNAVPSSLATKPPSRHHVPAFQCGLCGELFFFWFAIFPPLFLTKIPSLIYVPPCHSIFSFFRCSRPVFHYRSSWSSLIRSPSGRWFSAID